MAGVLRRQTAVEVTVVGAGALNQAVKAIAIARHHVTDDGFDLVCAPSFTDVLIDGQARTGMLLRIERIALSSERRPGTSRVDLSAPHGLPIVEVDVATPAPIRLDDARSPGSAGLPLSSTPPNVLPPDAVHDRSLVAIARASSSSRPGANGLGDRA